MVSEEIHHLEEVRRIATAVGHEKTAQKSPKDRTEATLTP